MDEDLPLVGVVIPNFNYSKYLPEAIDSVLAQTYPNIEIIVVDDGSTDNSIDILQNYEGKIRVIQQANSGVSAARNRGVSESQGKFIAFLDADDSWLPRKIERQISEFLTDPKLGLVHVGVNETDSVGNTLRIRRDGMEGEVSQELLLLRSAVLGGGSGLMVPRDVFDKIGGFDLNLSTSADWEIFYRISSRYPVGFVNETLVKYRMHGTNMHGNVPQMQRELLYAFEKIFKDDDVAIQSIRRNAYGNLYQILAGSYFRYGDYLRFLKCAVASLWFTPNNIKHFVAFPIRAVRSK